MLKRSFPPRRAKGSQKALKIEARVQADAETVAENLRSIGLIRHESARSDRSHDLGPQQQRGSAGTYAFANATNIAPPTSSLVLPGFRIARTVQEFISAAMIHDKIARMNRTLRSQDSHIIEAGTGSFDQGNSKERL
jgi:hypothetical protein